METWEAGEEEGDGEELNEPGDGFQVEFYFYLQIIDK